MATKPLEEKAGKGQSRNYHALRKPQMALGEGNKLIKGMREYHRRPNLDEDKKKDGKGDVYFGHRDEGRKRASRGGYVYPRGAPDAASKTISYDEEAAGARSKRTSLFIWDRATEEHMISSVQRK